jgi:hypothetical protein
LRWRKGKSQTLGQPAGHTNLDGILTAAAHQMAHYMPSHNPRRVMRVSTFFDLFLCWVLEKKFLSPQKLIVGIIITHFLYWL